MAESPWEDSLLERKVESDLKDLLKTLVAFANSVRPGHTAVILIGEKNDGTIQGVKDPDSIQKKVRTDAEKIYPAIIWQSRAYETSGRTCVRVEIEYSGNTPHFGGPAWIRKGSESVSANDEVFQLLVETRLDMVRELTKWLNRHITVKAEKRYNPRGSLLSAWPSYNPVEMKLVFVGAFWITLEDPSGTMTSLPISKIALNYDDAKRRLMILAT
jgi:hypothetical protein